MGKVTKAIELLTLIEAKTIGDVIWVHKSNTDEIPTDKLNKAKSLIGSFNYTIVKYNKSTHDISFIHSPDFDTSPEPKVGEIKLIKKGKVRTLIPSADPQIYHRKELMVKDDYKGFDVNKAKERTKKIDSLNVDKTRIGRLSYWKENVLPNL